MLQRAVVQGVRQQPGVDPNVEPIQDTPTHEGN